MNSKNFNKATFALGLLVILSSCGGNAKDKNDKLSFKKEAETLELADKYNLYDFVNFNGKKSLLSFSISKKIANIISETHTLEPIKKGDAVLTATYKNLTADCVGTLL